jgi:hypothetical protein
MLLAATLRLTKDTTSRLSALHLVKHKHARVILPPVPAATMLTASNPSPPEVTHGTSLRVAAHLVEHARGALPPVPAATMLSAPTPLHLKSLTACPSHWTAPGQTCACGGAACPSCCRAHCSNPPSHETTTSNPAMDWISAAHLVKHARVAMPPVPTATMLSASQPLFS